VRGCGQPTVASPLINAFSKMWGSFLFCVTLGFAKSASPRPLLPVRVANEDLQALCDTGAEISALNYSLCKRLGLKRFLRKTAGRVQSADGSELGIKGALTLPVVVGPREVMHDFLVIKGLRTECILGADFMATHGLVLDMDGQRRGSRSAERDAGLSQRVKLRWNLSQRNGSSAGHLGATWGI